jgi:nicotinamidase-related amidase
LLLPADQTLIMIDYQPQMAFATRSIGAIELRNNASLVAHAAKAFKVSTIIISVAEKSFSSPVFDEIKDAFPDDRPYTLIFAADRIAAPTPQAGVSIRPPDQRRRPAPQR